MTGIEIGITIEMLKGAMYTAGALGTYEAMDNLRNDPYYDSLNPAGRSSFDKDYAYYKRIKENLEEGAEQTLAQVMGMLAVAGVAMDVPDYEEELRAKYTHIHNVSEERHNALILDFNKRQWEEEFIAKNTVTGTANPSLQTGMISSLVTWLGGLFGSSPGKQTLPAIDALEMIGMLNCEYIRESEGEYDGARCTLYRVWNDFEFYRANGDYIKQFGNETETRIDGYIYYGKETIHNFYYVELWVFDGPMQGKLNPKFRGMDIMVWPVNYHKVGQFGSNGLGFPALKSEFGLPATPLVNNIAAVAGAIPAHHEPGEGDRGKYIPLPAIPTIPGTDDIDWKKYLPQLRDYDPTEAWEDTDAETGTGEKEGEKDKTKEDELEDVLNPPAQSINWPQLRNSWSRLAQVFPFCLPFDLVGVFTAFAAEPKMIEPITVNILPFMPGNTGRITVDFNIPGLDTLVKIFRVGMLILFVIGLIMATRGLITW
jgi:hypothetical protein